MHTGLRNNAVTELLDTVKNRTTYGGLPTVALTKATQIAYNSLTIKMNRVDWHILHALYGLKKAITITTIFVYSKAYMPVNGRDSYYVLYDALDRLTADNLITMSYGLRGSRNWMIAPKGLAILIDLNKKTLEIIQGWVKEAEELGHDT